MQGNNRPSFDPRAGFGTIVGSVVAFVLKFGLTAAMGTAFYLAVIS